MSDRRNPDMRSEFELLAQQRRAMLGREAIDHERGIPTTVVPCSGVGGDIVENREGDWS